MNVNSNLPVINMVWIGDKISNTERMCMQSFLYWGHPVHIWAYGNIDNLPSEVIVKDANQILGREKIFKHRNSYAPFADYFRWVLMRDVGGYYVDTDVVCLKPFDFIEDFLIGWEDTDKLLTQTILKVTGPNILVDEMIYCSENPLSFRPYDSFRMKRKKIQGMLKLVNRPKSVGWGMTAGPIGITNAYNYNKDRLDITPVSRETFYFVRPEDWRDIVEVNKLSINKLPKEAYGLHLWNNLWAKAGIDKNQKFDSNSLIGEFFDKYYKA